MEPENLPRVEAGMWGKTAAAMTPLALTQRNLGELKC
jgi:hypothetical protein